MTLLRGESLRERLQRGSVAYKTLLGWLLPAMRGVDAAHRAGVVHRDIKPDNLFLQSMPDGMPPCCKVLDFGACMLTQGAAGFAELTSTGQAVGTPAYMPLEQLRGQRDTDARVDVYAFGVVLYEALTGTLPFEASSLSELCLRLSTGTAPPAPSRFVSSVPAWLDAALLRALRRDPEERFANMGEFVHALASPAGQASVRSGCRLPTPWRWAFAVALAGCATAAVWPLARGALVAAATSSPSRTAASGPSATAKRDVAMGDSPITASGHRPQPSLPDVDAAEPNPERTAAHNEPSLTSGRPKRAANKRRRRQPSPAPEPPSGAGPLHLEDFLPQPDPR